MIMVHLLYLVLSINHWYNWLLGGRIHNLSYPFYFKEGFFLAWDFFLCWETCFLFFLLGRSFVPLGFLLFFVCERLFCIWVTNMASQLGPIFVSFHPPKLHLRGGVNIGFYFPYVRENLIFLHTLLSLLRLYYYGQYEDMWHNPKITFVTDTHIWVVECHTLFWIYYPPPITVSLSFPELA